MLAIHRKALATDFILRLCSRNSVSAEFYLVVLTNVSANMLTHASKLWIVYVLKGVQADASVNQDNKVVPSE